MDLVAAAEAQEDEVGEVGRGPGGRGGDSTLTRWDRGTGSSLFSFASFPVLGACARVEIR